MTFPSSGTTTTLSRALDQACDIAGSVKALASQYAATMASTTVSSAEVLMLLDRFVSAKVTLTALAALPGMDTYAESVLGQSVSAGFTSMITALTNAGAWIVTNMPKDTDGYLLAQTFNSDGTVAYRNFTVQQMAGLQTLLTTLAATIS